MNKHPLSLTTFEVVQKHPTVLTITENKEDCWKLKFGPGLYYNETFRHAKLQHMDMLLQGNMNCFIEQQRQKKLCRDKK